LKTDSGSIVNLLAKRNTCPHSQPVSYNHIPDADTDTAETCSFRSLGKEIMPLYVLLTMHKMQRYSGFAHGI